MEIRKATIEDSAAIARDVMAAMDFDMFGDGLSPELAVMLEGMTEICAREDTLYGWKNTLVAVADESDGASAPVVAGSLTSYDGARYLEMRELTFALAREKFGWQPPMMDDETGPGEWYLDSLAVLPQFRGRGIPKMLMDRMFDEALSCGIGQVSLIALASADRLVAYYGSLGFRPDRHLSCFGHDYLRMVRPLESALNYNSLTAQL